MTDTPRTEAASLLRSEVRRVVTDAYYEARNAGETMETAADNAADAVMALAAFRPAAKPEAGLRMALARWIVDEGDGSMSVRPTGDMRYGYGVAKAEIRSILRDPSGEHATPDPTPEEAAAYAETAREESKP